MLFGAMLPYMFAALTMISVGKAAAEIIMEVRDQFHNRPDLVAQDGKTTLKDCIIMASNGEPIPPHMDVIPDSNKCVAISTKSSAEIIMEVRDQFHNRPDLVAQDGKT